MTNTAPTTRTAIDHDGRRNTGRTRADLTGKLAAYTTSDGDVLIGTLEPAPQGIGMIVRFEDGGWAHAGLTHVDLVQN